MGKWSTVTYPVGFEKRCRELEELSDQDINSLWIQHGSLSLDDFTNMSWYWSQTNGWACIDNCEGKNPPANFKIYCMYSKYINDIYRNNFEKIAVILACEFNMPRYEVIKETVINKETLPVQQEKPVGHNLNMLVEGSSIRPQLQIHIFKSRYGDGVIAFLSSGEEQAEKIIDSFTGGDTGYGQITLYFSLASWFPIVYGNNAIEAIEKMIDLTNQSFVNDDILQWTRAVERACCDIAFTTCPKDLPSNLKIYMEGW